MSDSVNSKDHGQVDHKENYVAAADLSHVKVAINTKLALINLWAGCAAFAYGFGAAIIASSLGQPNLYTYFKLVGKSNLTEIIGAIASLLNVGGIFGLIMTSLIMEKYGRKFSFWVSTFFYVLGTCLSGGAVNVPMLIMGRFIVGIGGWGYLNGAIVYAQELAPATRRGTLGGAVGVALSAGYTLAAWVGVGFYFMKNENNWRAAILISLIFPLLVVIGLPLVPESPRWLIFVGREAEALVILKDLHGSPDDAQDIVANEEFFQIVQQTRLDKTLPSSWASMFTTYGKRTLYGCLLIGIYQSTGIQIIANYGPILYSSVGFSAVDSLLIAGGTSIWSLILNTVCALFVDTTGRRPMIVGSIMGSGIVLIVFCALLAVNPDGTKVAMSRATVALIYIYLIPYSFCEPVAFLYIGEIFPTHVRTKGSALNLLIVQFMSVWITFGQPVGTAKIHWKFYLIFVVLSIGGSLLLHFTLPETKNVPLEEIAKLFGEDQVAVLAEDIRIDEKTHEVQAATHRGV